MGAISIIAGLASAIPNIVGLFKGGGAEEKANQVLDIAKKLTGIDDDEGAVSAIKEDPALLLEFKSKLLDHDLAQRELDIKEKVEHNRNTAEMEGTAKDLLAVPMLGHIMLFLRGSQRIFWGFGSLFMTFMVLSGKWKFLQAVQGPNGAVLNVTDTQKMFLFICIDLLVLATLFGERALRNLLPIILDKLMPIFSRK